MVFRHAKRTTGFGCIDCKKIPFEKMIGELAPIQRRVKGMNQNPRYVVDILRPGALLCKSIAEKVMDEVREKIGVKSDWLSKIEIEFGVFYEGDRQNRQPVPFFV